MSLASIYNVAGIVDEAGLLTLSDESGEEITQVSVPEKLLTERDPDAINQWARTARLIEPDQVVATTGY